MRELETRLRNHAEAVKKAIEPPLHVERTEQQAMTNKNRKIRKTILLAAAVLCLLSTGALAAYRYLTPKEVASELGDVTLAQHFENSSTLSETVTDGAYSATLLGIMSGENLSDFKSSAWEIFPERTYAVVAVEKTDGTPMTYDDEILVTPFIQGFAPWEHNIFTMNGGYVADIIDGVLYRIVEFDSVEYFADRTVYLAVVSDCPFINNKPYAYDAETGVISPKADYENTNILFTLSLDPAKADPAKAEAYLEKLDEYLRVEAEF